MTKFRDAEDSGYKRVRDQLWLWVNNISEYKQGTSSVPHEALQSESNNQEHDGTTNVPHPLPHSESRSEAPHPVHRHEYEQSSEADRPRTVSSGGGPIFMGKVTVGRDFNNNNR